MSDAFTNAKVAERLRKCLQSITTPVRIRTLAFLIILDTWPQFFRISSATGFFRLIMAGIARKWQVKLF